MHARVFNFLTLKSTLCLSPPFFKGNGAAMRHFQATGNKYPLCVKLGTITAKGGDVFSYAPDEDDMVLDPKLGEHLEHWGINMMQQTKTEKNMTELQIELQTKAELGTVSV
jgi:ubiquitin carboxyl-terminal hydrolase 5/13